MRYICGVFSRGKEDTEKLFQDLKFCQGALFFQPFWTKKADGDADGSSGASRLTDEVMAAVATRFAMGVPKNVKDVAVYPAYVVVRGPSQSVSVPHIIYQPNWPDDLFPHGSGIEKGLGRLVDVPRLPQENNNVDLQDSLPLRQRWHPLIFGGREFTSFFSGWGVLAHRSAARRKIFGGPGTIEVRWPGAGAHAKIGRRRAFVCPLVGRSRGSLWSCFRGRLVGHGMLACPTGSMVEPGCRCRFQWSQ